MLRPGQEFPPIRKLSVRRWHAGFVLLDPSLHLSDQPGPQIGERCKNGLRMVVLGVDMGANFGCELRWVLNRLTPVRIPEPGIVVDPLDPMVGQANRFASGDGRRRSRHRDIGGCLLRAAGRERYEDDESCNRPRPAPAHRRVLLCERHARLAIGRRRGQGSRGAGCVMSRAMSADLLPIPPV